MKKRVLLKGTLSVVMATTLASMPLSAVNENLNTAGMVYAASDTEETVIETEAETESSDASVTENSTDESASEGETTDTSEDDTANESNDNDAETESDESEDASDDATEESTEDASEVESEALNENQTSYSISSNVESCDDVLDIEVRFVTYSKTLQGEYVKDKKLLSTHKCKSEPNPTLYLYSPIS